MEPVPIQVELLNTHTCQRVWQRLSSYGILVQGYVVIAYLKSKAVKNFALPSFAKMSSILGMVQMYVLDTAFKAL